MAPGVTSGSRRIWDRDSLTHSRHALFELRIASQAVPLRTDRQFHEWITVENGPIEHDKCGVELPDPPAGRLAFSGGSRDSGPTPAHAAC